MIIPLNLQKSRALFYTWILRTFLSLLYSSHSINWFILHIRYPVGLKCRRVKLSQLDIFTKDVGYTMVMFFWLHKASAYVTYFNKCTRFLVDTIKGSKTPFRRNVWVCPHFWHSSSSIITCIMLHNPYTHIK